MPTDPAAVELIEADAAQLYDETMASEGFDGRWPDCPDNVRGVFRFFACHPYFRIGEPR